MRETGFEPVQALSHTVSTIGLSRTRLTAPALPHKIENKKVL